jgi:hypothetical protein
LRGRAGHPHDVVDGSHPHEAFVTEPLRQIRHSLELLFLFGDGRAEVFDACTEVVVVSTHDIQQEGQRESIGVFEEANSGRGVGNVREGGFGGYHGEIYNLGLMCEREM